MANFYMNLSRAGSGYSGTTGDPYSWTDYVSLRLGPTFSNDDTIYVKGNVSTGEYELSPGADWIVFDKWDTSHPNGSDDAWRLELSYAGGISTDLYGVFFKRGVIYYYGTNEIVVGASGGGHNFQNFLLYADTADIGIGNSDNSILRGCSLRTPGVFSSYLNATILDSSIECASVFIASRGGSLTSTNCSYSPGSVDGPLTSCQLNWTAGVEWPAYESDQSLFAFTILGATLGAPAVPGAGAPSYTGYDTDPWGNARTNIGAFSFPPSSHSVDFSAGANGSLTGDVSQTVADGGDASAVTAVPDTNYHFTAWSGDNTSTDNPLTLTNVTSDKSCVANFAIDTVPSDSSTSSQSSESSLLSESSNSSVSSLSSDSSLSSQSSESSSLSSSSQSSASSEFLSIGSEVVPSVIDISGGDVPVASTVNVAKLLLFPSVVADLNFNAENKWNTVIVIYEHANGQNKKFVHRLRGSSWTASDIFTQFANTGSWLKNRIILTDNEGDMLVIERAEIGDDEDLTVTSFVESP